MDMNKTLLVSAIGMALTGANTANAALVTDLYGAFDWSTDSANFTMLSAIGATVGGTNNVSMLWDGNGYDSSSDYTGPGSMGNVTASSTTPFFGHTWTAHDIQVFMPGSYSFDATLGGGVAEVGFLNVTVPAGMLGMHMLFDWNGGLNIDVFVVAATSSVFGSGIGRSTQNTTTTYGSVVNNCDNGTVKNCLYDGKDFGAAGKPAGSNVWMAASVDGNGDGIMGVPMPNGGPFAGFNANFNASLSPTPDAVSTVPSPAGAWLLASGLAALVGADRHRRSIVAGNGLPT